MSPFLLARPKVTLVFEGGLSTAIGRMTDPACAVLWRCELQSLIVRKKLHSGPCFEEARSKSFSRLLALFFTL